jgi:hypothetical protein
MARPAPTTRASLHEIADLQDAVVTRRQLHEFGYDVEAVRAQIAARRWQPFGRRVVALHNGPLTIRQQRWAAVLSQHRAALAGITAAAEQGLVGFDDSRIHLLVEYGARLHPIPDVRLHVSRRFDLRDVHTGRGLPAVRIERALVDAASWIPAPRKPVRSSPPECNSGSRPRSGCVLSWRPPVTPGITSC